MASFDGIREFVRGDIVQYVRARKQPYDWSRPSRDYVWQRGVILRRKFQDFQRRNWYEVQFDDGVTLDLCAMELHLLIPWSVE